MKKRIAIMLIVLLGLGALGCDISSRNLTRSNVSSIQRVDGSEEQLQPYRDVNVVVWEVDARGTKAEAHIETLNMLLKDAPSELPLSRLMVKNLATNQVIYQRNVDDRPLSMYTRDLNGDGFSELILTWYKGAVAERIEILSVNATQARVLLDEPYRVDATLMLLADKTVDVLITTGDSGVEPFYTTRYVWRSDGYEVKGKTPYENLVSIIEQQFR